MTAGPEVTRRFNQVFEFRVQFGHFAFALPGFSRETGVALSRTFTRIIAGEHGDSEVALWSSAEGSVMFRCATGIDAFQADSFTMLKHKTDFRDRH